jgi:hypothetical protein
LLNTMSTDSVLWLGEGAPPALLAAHLREHDLTLVTEPRAFDAEFDGFLPARRVALLDELAPRDSGRLSLGGRRIALVHPDAHGAEALSLSLRARGAQVVTLSTQRESFQRAEQLDPDLVLIAPEQFYGASWELVQAIWDHPRLRWATILLIMPESLGFGSVRIPDVRLLCAAIQGLSVHAERLEGPVAEATIFDLHLDRLGPARTLRMLVESQRSLRAEFWGTEATVEIDVAKELVIGARGVRHTEPPQKVHGPAALEMFLGLEQGVVSVREVSHPAVANVMAPFDAALHLAGEAAARAETELPTRPQPFEDVPTRQVESPRHWEDVRRWEEPLPLGADDSSNSLDITVAQEPSPVAAISAPVPMSALKTDSGYQTGPREPVDTAPFRAQLRLWRAVTAGAATVGVALLVGWLLWPERGAQVAMRPAERLPAPAAAVGASAPRAEPVRGTPAPAPAQGEQHEGAAPELLEDEPEPSEAPPVFAGESSSARGKALHANALAEHGNYLRTHGFYTEARGKYLEALELYAESPRALNGLARLSLVQGRPDEAVKYAEELVRLRPGQGVYHLVLGDAYRAANMPEKARAAWRVAARLGHPRARARLAD